MKLIAVAFCLGFAVCIQSADSHFFKWAWNKIRHVLDPNESRRPLDCGHSDVPQMLPARMDAPRVTGGLSAVDHSFPWMVNVINVKSLRSCGGTIVGPDTIITGNDHC